MKIRWNEMTVSAKVMIIVRIVASIGVMVLAVLNATRCLSYKD